MLNDSLLRHCDYHIRPSNKPRPRCRGPEPQADSACLTSAGCSTIEKVHAVGVSLGE